MVSIILELDAYEHRRFQKALASSGKTPDQLVSDFLANGACTENPAEMVHAPDAAESAQGRGDNERGEAPDPEGRPILFGIQPQVYHFNPHGDPIPAEQDNERGEAPDPARGDAGGQDNGEEARRG